MTEPQRPERRLNVGQAIVLGAIVSCIGCAAAVALVRAVLR